MPALPKGSMGRGGDVDLISMTRCFWQQAVVSSRSVFQSAGHAAFEFA